MFAYIRGKLAFQSLQKVIIDNHGIGYEIFIPINVGGNLPQLGSEVQLFTVFVVRELSQTLYGFTSEEQRELFYLLIDVNGIGPKTALSIIGHLSMDEFADALKTGSVKTMCKVPGIGKKTAERLLIEMRDKVSFKCQHAELAKNPKNKTIKDAMNALINLGYSQTAAENALKKTLENMPDETDLALLITKTLKNF